LKKGAERTGADRIGREGKGMVFKPKSAKAMRFKKRSTHNKRRECVKQEQSCTIMTKKTNRRKHHGKFIQG
jgi:hypothetical protein